MIQQFTKLNIDSFSAGLRAVITKYCAEQDCKVEFGRGGYSDAEFQIKTTVRTQKGVERVAENKGSFLEMEGLRMGYKFMSPTGICMVTGYNTKARRMPVSYTKSDGTKMKCTAGFVKQFPEVK